MSPFTTSERTKETNPQKLAKNSFGPAQLDSSHSKGVVLHSVPNSISNSVHLKVCGLPQLTHTIPLQNCRVCVAIPVRNEAETLPAVIKALAQQIDAAGNPLDSTLYEVLILANNCSDRTVHICESLRECYPQLQLHIIDIYLPKADAYVGKVRQMVMDEAYRRLSLIGLQNRIIASTDGDTRVSPSWISALIREFDLGVEAVGGRIITRRAAEPGMRSDISLYYLRRLGHEYLSAQLECLIDPQIHDSWPRHSQYNGANMSVLATMYGQIGGMPLVQDEEDVALYQQLKRADAKIRHSLNVQVFTSARQQGRATGGLSKLLQALAHSSRKRQAHLAELPQITESRFLLRQQLRQIWSAVHQGQCFEIRPYERTAELLAKQLGLCPTHLRQAVEETATFGRLVEAIANYQKQKLDLQQLLKATTEISRANMQLRARIQAIRQKQNSFEQDNPYIILQTLQQIQAIPLFSFTR
ncbi:MAG: Glycosyltransferase [Phormidesmis priestleyi Ana]|uniref:4,4'-diaponeurosporenoate glycosyltransferase n=1 Tax=Phormidesmis priestleyi Ana TaxID=1666911 RepID=A0A0P8DCM8_9CYAN|nr:MAG: Glycosyltransferase [Phormidesmis priestleyi Ana]